MAPNIKCGVGERCGRASRFQGHFANNSSSMKNKTSQSAFTFVELLVCIAIIVMLVALLLPGLQRVKETAKNTKCVSNLRQICIATFTYAADNNGFAPYDENLLSEGKNDGLFIRWSNNNSDGSFYRPKYPKNKWFADYIGTTAYGTMNPVGYCPKGGRFGEVGIKTADGYFNVSYGINPDLIADWYLTNLNSSHADRGNCTITQIKNPAKTCLWIDANKSTVYQKSANTSGRHFSYKKEPSKDTVVLGLNPIYRSLGKVNVAFVDQHISSLKIPEQTPDYACRFWNHTNDKCAKGNCKACDQDLLF
jgi:type II secretory pathway pseudopilin PulG